MIRVILADDHEIVLAGLIRLIDETADIKVVGVAQDGDGALRLALAGDGAWDVLVLDLSLPGVGGAEVLRRVREHRPHARVVVLSMYPEDQYATQLIHAGALAFVSKVSPPEMLLSAVRAAASGRVFVSREVDRRLRMAYEQDADLPHKGLTSREHQVFVLIADGRSTVEAAVRLGLSASTVSSHVAAIKDKLGVKTTLEIVKYAHRNGLTD